MQSKLIWWAKRLYWGYVAVADASAWLSFQRLQSEMVLVFTCLSVFPAKPIITAIIPVREISTANPPSPSCKQIMLRGLDDVCVRNEIIWNQFRWSRCAFSGSSASGYSWDETVQPLEGSWLLQRCLPDERSVCDVLGSFVSPNCIYPFCISRQTWRLCTAYFNNEFRQIQLCYSTSCKPKCHIIQLDAIKRRLILFTWICN